MKTEYRSKLKYYMTHSLNIFKELFNFRLIRKNKVSLIFERVHLKKFFKEFQIDCVFDIGANYGQYAKMLRNNVGYKGQIISFEPIPAAQKILYKLSKSDPKWHIEPFALSDLSGKEVFNIMKNDQFSSLHKPSNNEVELFNLVNKVSEELIIETKTLSFMFEKYKTLLKFKKPFLKMDTQGHDLQIAKGSENILKSFVGLQSELSIKRIYDDTPDFKKVIEYYNSQNFELSAFVPNNEGHFPRLIEIDCIMYNKNFLT